MDTPQSHGVSVDQISTILFHLVNEPWQVVLNHGNCSPICRWSNHGFIHHGYGYQLLTMTSMILIHEAWWTAWTSYYPVGGFPIFRDGWSINYFFAEVEITKRLFMTIINHYHTRLRMQQFNFILGHPQTGSGSKWRAATRGQTNFVTRAGC